MSVTLLRRRCTLVLRYSCFWCLPQNILNRSTPRNYPRCSKSSRFWDYKKTTPQSSDDLQRSGQGVGVPLDPSNSRTKHKATRVLHSQRSLKTAITASKCYLTRAATLITSNNGTLVRHYTPLSYASSLHSERPRPRSGRPIRARDVTQPWTLLTVSALRVWPADRREWPS